MSLLKTVNKHLDYFAVIIITLIAQGYWVLNRGVHAETYWITRNWNTGFFDGFFYSDPSRPFMSLTFHLVYLFFGTSYTAIQCVYLLFAVCISLLTYVLSRRLQITRLFSIFAGLIAATHAGDQSNQLFSMIVVKQIVIIELIIAILLVPQLPIEVKNKKRKIKHSKHENDYNLLIFIICTIGLFTYESLAPVLIILLIVLWVINKKLHKGLLFGLMLWITFTLNRYVFEKDVSYQSSKFRIPNFGEIIQSLHSYVSNGFNPFRWFEFYNSGIFMKCSENLYGIIRIPSFMAILFIILILSVVKNESIDEVNIKNSRLILIICLLLASYLPYLFVVDGTGNWRTQFLAIPWIAILIVLLSEKIARNFGNRFINAGLSILIAAFISLGVFASLIQQLEFSARWDNHLRFFNSLFHQLNFPKPNSEILVVNVPDKLALDGLCKTDLVDPFEDPYWFQASLNAYFQLNPNTAFYLRKSQTNSETIIVDNAIGEVVTKNHKFDVNKLILVEFLSNGKAKVIDPPEAFSRFHIRNLPPYQSLLSDNIPKPNALGNLKNRKILRP